MKSQVVLAQAAVAQKEIAKLQSLGTQSEVGGKGAQGGGKAGAKGAKDAAAPAAKAVKKKPDQVPFAPADWATYELPADIMDSFAHIDIYKLRGLNRLSITNPVYLYLLLYCKLYTRTVLQTVDSTMQAGTVHLPALYE